MYRYQDVYRYQSDADAGNQWSTDTDTRNLGSTDTDT